MPTSHEEERTAILQVTSVAHLLDRPLLHRVYILQLVGYAALQGLHAMTRVMHMTGAPCTVL